MSKKLILSALTTAIMIGSFGANAALEYRLGGNAYYDTVLDITILTNANAGTGSAFDDGLNPNDGNMTWESAKQWAETTDFYGISAWRLPTADKDNNGDICESCTDNELSYLFGVEGISASNYFPFNNFHSTAYWTSTDIGQPDGTVTIISTIGGFVSKGADKNFHQSAWAVKDGDVVSQIPEPSTYAMLLAGLGFVGFMVRDRV